jgi:hypothetical protein
MASYQHCSPTVRRRDIAEGQRNAALARNAAWLTDRTAIAPPCVALTTQPTDPEYRGRSGLRLAQRCLG